MDYVDILKNIHQAQVLPIYLLYGEEAFFIEKIYKALEEYALDEDEKAFNEDIFYGEETSAAKLISQLRAFPVMSRFRIVYLKNAEKLKKAEWKKLEKYFEKPIETSVFVVVYNGKFGQKKVINSTKKYGLAFESKKLYENQIGNWISTELSLQKIKINNDAKDILISNIGADLKALENELRKLILHLKRSNSNEITKELVYQYSDIDREYNVFELVNVIGEKDTVKAIKITQHLLENQKSAAGIIIVSQVFKFFTQLALLKAGNIKKADDIARELGINRFFASRYITAYRNFTYMKVKQNLRHALETDLQLKGFYNSSIEQKLLIQNFIYEIVK